MDYVQILLWVNMNWHVKVCLMLLTLALKGHGENGTMTSAPPLTPSFDLYCAAIMCDETNISITMTETRPETWSLRIMGDVKLSLKCRAESYSSSLNNTGETTVMDAPLNNTTQNSLNIIHISGDFVAAAEHINMTISVNISVIDPPKNLRCVLQDEVLECVCNCSGLPLANTSLPRNQVLILRCHYNHTHAQESSTYSNATLNKPGTFSDGAECVCENDAGKKQGNQSVWTGNDVSKGTRSNFMKFDKRTFLICLVGLISLGLIICVTLSVVALWTRRRAHTERHVNTNKEDIHLESNKSLYSQENLNLIGADEAVKDEEVPDDQPASNDKNTGATDGITETRGPLGQDEVPGGNKTAEDRGARELDYACINYSLLQSRHGNDQQKTEETEYAEIQLKTQDNGEKEECLQSRVNQGAMSQLEGGVDAQTRAEREEI